jgi:hypothetical protein
MHRDWIRRHVKYHEQCFKYNNIKILKRVDYVYRILILISV